jgi:hypothetical protein
VKGPIEVSIRVDDRDGQTAGSLYRWLVLDQQVRRDATVSVRPAPPGAGEMGGAVDVINMVLSNSIALGGLLVAVSSWRRSRPTPPTTRIEGDGFSLIIEDASPETVRRVLDALTDRPADPGEGAGDAAI